QGYNHSAPKPLGRLHEPSPYSIKKCVICCRRSFSEAPCTPRGFGALPNISRYVPLSLPRLFGWKIRKYPAGSTTTCLPVSGFSKIVFPVAETHELAFGPACL